jgi:hypothetical protein
MGGRSATRGTLRVPREQVDERRQEPGRRVAGPHGGDARDLDRRGEGPAHQAGEVQREAVAGQGHPRPGGDEQREALRVDGLVVDPRAEAGGWAARVTDTVQSLTGRAPRSLDQVLRAADLAATA